MSGGLNLSELDGWWAEAYNPELGWALGDGHEHGDDPSWDNIDADALYDILEHEVVPSFYNRSSDGMPSAWLQKMRSSMAMLTPRFSANRAVREYTEKYYLPAATSYRERSKDKGSRTLEALAFEKALRINWSSLRFGELNIQSKEQLNIFEVQLCVGGLNPDFIKIQLYADGINDSGPVRIDMERVGPVAFVDNTFLYRAMASTSRPPQDFTPRAFPYHRNIKVPLETAQILWRG